MLDSHNQQLRERAAQEETILVAQDTTTLNFSNRQISGIGLVGNGGTKGGHGPLAGMYVHTGLAMSTEGLPLGITSQKIYTRKAETTTVQYRATIKRKSITEKETVRWVEAVSASKKVLPTSSLVIIGDRESNIYEVFREGVAQGVNLLIRASINRKLVGEELKLFEKVADSEIVTTYEADVPNDAHTTSYAFGMIVNERTNRTSV